MARLEEDSLVQDALREQGMRSDYDCLSCRVMGASAFVGLGTYTYWSGHRTLNANKSIIDKSRGVNLAARRLGITGTAAALVGLGIYRLFG